MLGVIFEILDEINIFLIYNLGEFIVYLLRDKKKRWEWCYWFQLKFS